MKTLRQKRRCYLLIILVVLITIFLRYGTLLSWDSVTNEFDAEQYYSPDVYPKKDEFSLRAIVIVFNRTESMLRLLDSLNNAYYGNDTVALEIWIDRNKDGNISVSTHAAALNFEFKHGTKDVFVHERHVGLYGQWLTTYKPKTNSSEIAVILEDDLTVSPHFYTYLKMVHRKYGAVPDITGFSLQGIIMKFANGSSDLVEGPTDDPVYLYPVIGSWGFSPRAENWANFLSWFNIVSNVSSFHPYIPNNIASEWYKMHEASGRADEMWTIWHVFYAWKFSQFTLYSNFPNNEGLTTNWAEKGLHYTGNDTGKQSNPLLQNWKLTYDQLPDKPVKLDIAGHVITPPIATSW